MKSSLLPSHLFLLAWIGSAGLLARAQEGVSPEAAPAPDEATPPTSGTAPTANVSLSPPSAPVENAPTGSRLTAPRVTYEGGTIVAQGEAGSPVVFQSALGRLEAREVRLNTLTQTLSAAGDVRLERQVAVDRRELRANSLEKLRRRGELTQTFVGQNLKFDFKTRKGTIDSAVVRSDVDLSANQLEINGERYTARGVVIRPGGLNDEERRIYGTPPLSIRAREVDVRRDTRAGRYLLGAHGAALYVGNTRLLPLPGAVLGFGGGQNQRDFKVTPTISFNGADRFFLGTRLAFPLASDPRALSLLTNLGYSARVGFRGGASLATRQSFGDFRLSGQFRDIVTTQLTNRLEVDRRPELTYFSPALTTFSLPRFGRAGFFVDGGYGRFVERSIGGGGVLGSVSSDRIQGRLLFSTRLDPRSGPFVRAFASTARYSRTQSHYDSTGVQLGFAGQLVRRINGEVSLRLTNVRGQTPFRFDLIEIPRELRTTFDVELTPRFLLPIDVRYDLGQSKVRDSTFGLLRSYKVFAYGVVYQTARRDLRLEVRSAF